MNGLALCAGAGGLELGVELAVGDAYRTVCGVEWEATAAAVLVARQRDRSLPPFPVWSDLRSFNGRPWRGVVDIVTAGFPCQPFSVAGKRGGTEDPRHLWPHVARVICECDPGIVFLENVPGLLTTPLADGSGFAYELVEDELHRMGYRVATGLFTASEVGAPHRRERLFILAHRDSNEWNADTRIAPGNFDDGRRRLADAGFGQLSQPGRGAQGRDGAGPAGAMVHTNEQGLERRGEPLGERRHERPARTPIGTFPPGPGDTEAWRRILGEHPEYAPAVEPVVRGVADGLATGLDLPRAAQLRLTGNGVVPAQAEYAFRLLQLAHAGHDE